MKLEKEAIIEKTLTELKTDKNEYPFHIELRMMLSEKERQLVKKHFGDRNVKLTLEYQEPILDEAEKRYLSDVIRPFRDRVQYIAKRQNDNYKEEYIIIMINRDLIFLPNFKENTMYKDMELDKKYTLEELGL